MLGPKTHTRCSRTFKSLRNRWTQYPHRKKYALKRLYLNFLKGEQPIIGFDDINMGVYNMTEDEARKISKEFDHLRFEVRRKGLLNGETSFFTQKLFECLAIIGLALILQLKGYYILAALCMGLAWQQLGWMIHEYCHHQHFKVRHRKWVKLF